MKKSIKNNTETLGVRLKNIEAQYEIKIEPEKHLICRIDGHKFSKFTKGFVKPFDLILSEAMELTTKDLVNEFNAVVGYTQSDEITLVIPSLKDVTVDNRKSYKHKTHKRIMEDWEHSYGGRVQKMNSLISSFSTMKFNLHLKSLLPTVGFDSPEDYGIFHDDKDVQHTLWLNYLSMLEFKKIGNAWFDCRIFGVEGDKEAFNSILWRVRDCEKNSRSMFAQTYCSHKELQNFNGLEQVEFCLNKTGKDWNNIDDRYKYGILVKRETYFKKVNNDYSIENNRVERTRLVSFSKKLVYSTENVELILSKKLYCKENM
jgi:tRNA(His) guanylyltransferase